MVSTTATFPAKQYLNRRICSRERFIAGLCLVHSPQNLNSWIFTETKDRRGCPFQHFKVSFDTLTCGCDRSQRRRSAHPWEGVFSRCWCDSSIWYWREHSTKQEEEKEEMQLLRDCWCLGCGHWFLSRGVGMLGLWSLRITQECDVRELLGPGLLGSYCQPDMWLPFVHKRRISRMWGEYRDNSPYLSYYDTQVLMTKKVGVEDSFQKNIAGKTWKLSTWKFKLQ